MNATCTAPNGLATVGVALLGRVPVSTGKVNKGDRLILSDVPMQWQDGDVTWRHVLVEL